MASRSRRSEFVSLAAVAIVLVSAAWFARSHAESLKQFIDDHPIKGVVVYISLNALLTPGGASGQRSSPRPAGQPAPSSRSILRVDGARQS